MAGINLGPHVVSGEADESDEEVPTPIKRQNPSASVNPVHPNAAGSEVVVSGEASESEDEDLETNAAPIEKTYEIPPLKVDRYQTIDEHTASRDQTHKPKAKSKPKSKYDSLLHQKLREKNSSFHHSLQEHVGQVYFSSAKELNNISAQLTKSQIAVQDISHNMRILTNDLFHLEDKIDIVASCNILPNINIEVPEHIHSSEGAYPAPNR